MTVFHPTDQPPQPAAVEGAPQIQPPNKGRPGHTGGVLQLLDREPPTGYVQESTERIASVKVEVQPGIQSILIFRLGSEWLSLPSGIVGEVAPPQPLHTVPHRIGGIVSGIISVRGDLLLCFSLGAVLGLAELTANRNERFHAPAERLIVIHKDGNRLAFPVDEVFGIERYHPCELKEAPNTLSGSAPIEVIFTPGLLPWKDRTVGCLDAEVLFSNLNKRLSWF